MPGIDGLRAIAVAAVFVYHADGGWLPGGFLGVDVFFVISGYLITSLLLAELARRGACRARALLGRARAAPAAGAVPAARRLPAGRGDDRARQARRAARRRAVVDLLRRQLALHLRARELLRPVRAARRCCATSGRSRSRSSSTSSGRRCSCSRARAAAPRCSLPALVALAAVGSTALMWALYTPGADTSRIFYGTDTRAAPLLVGVLLAFVWRPVVDDARSARARPARARRRQRCAALGAVVYMFVDRPRLRPRSPTAAASSCSRSARRCCSRRSSTRRAALGRALGARACRAGSASAATASTSGTGRCSCLTRPGVDVHLARGLLIPLAGGGHAWRSPPSPTASSSARSAPARCSGCASAAAPAARSRGRRSRSPAPASPRCWRWSRSTPSGATALPPGFTRTALAAVAAGRARTSSCRPLPGTTAAARRHAAPRPHPTTT